MDKRERGGRDFRGVAFLIVLCIALAICLIAISGSGHAVEKISEIIPSKDEAVSSEAAVSVRAKSKIVASATDDSSKVVFHWENSVNDEFMKLVNAENQLEEDYYPELETIEEGWQFDARAAHMLEAMLNEARRQGLSPIICSAYRSVETQRELFTDKVVELMAEGLSQEAAEEQTREVIAYPGSSEHGLGLAADIVSKDYQLLDEGQTQTPEFIWLQEHCAEYGFILRYPKGKEDVTGIIYEPWHFRYVGEKAAEEIMAEGICLEEYLSR